MNHQKPIEYADDDYESVRILFKLRAQALGVGLLLAVGISLITSRFEGVLTQHVQVAYFLPFVVYLAAAVGTQTEAIYARDLKTGKARFHNCTNSWRGASDRLDFLERLFEAHSPHR